MKKILLLAFAFCPLQILIAQTTAKELDSLMTGYTLVQKFNGTVLVARNGQVILEKGYGNKNFTNASLNDANTIYQVASITKQFTSTVILKLVESHKLSLTDRLTKFYPQYPNGDSITIFHLLTHTAGIPNYTLDSAFMKDVVRASAKPLNFSEALMRYNRADFAPGTRWRYSNQGYMLLGGIIQQVTHISWYEAVRNYIFRPLHMDNSGFDFANLRSSDKATGYYSYPSKSNGEVAPIIDSAEPFSAGCIYSTVGDLYKWHEGLQHYTIVSRASLEQAYTPFRDHYGFGWVIDSLFDKRVVSHSGDIDGFKTNIARITDDDVCIILLNNIEDEEMRGQITRDILAVLYDKPYAVPVKRQEITLSEDVLLKYAGTYAIPNLTIHITVEAGQMWIQTVGQPKTRLYAENDNYFFSKVVEAQLEFVADGTGKVTKAVLYMGGQRLEGKRVGD